MNIKEWAKINNLTPEQFKNDIAEIMAAIGTMDIDDKPGKSMAVWTLSDSKGPIQVIVRRAPKPE